MKICLIGCGDHAHRVYLPSLRRCQQENGELVLAACCDINKEQAEKTAQEAGFARAYTDFEEMLDAEKPDAALIVTSYMVTAKIASAVMQRGVAALIEKPPGETIVQTEELAAQVAAQPCLHQVAFNRRHIPAVRALKADIAARGAQVQHIDFAMYRVRRTDDNFYTTAVHGVDLVCNLAQAPCARAQFMYGDATRFGDNVRNFLMHFNFANGVTAALTVCPVSGELSERVKLVTDAGTYRVETPLHGDGDDGSLTFTENRQTVPMPASDGATIFESNGFYYQLHSFLQDVRAGKQPADTLAACLDSMRLSDCLRRLAATYEAE